MTKKKRYTLTEVNRMYKIKYPYGNVEIEKVNCTPRGYGYRVGYGGQNFKTLKDVVINLQLER